MTQKILVIDDQPSITKLLKVRLKANGYEVILAEDGQDGIEKVKSEGPDLIITDLAMPKMTGNIVVRILKRSPRHQHIPIIMLSAFVHENEREGIEIPADDYVSKPFDSDILMGKVKDLLAKKESYSE